MRHVDPRHKSQLMNVPRAPLSAVFALCLLAAAAPARAETLYYALKPDFAGSKLKLPAGWCHLDTTDNSVKPIQEVDLAPFQAGKKLQINACQNAQCGCTPQPVDIVPFLDLSEFATNAKNASLIIDMRDKPDALRLIFKGALSTPGPQALLLRDNTLLTSITAGTGLKAETWEQTLGNDLVYRFQIPSGGDSVLPPTLVMKSVPVNAPVDAVVLGPDGNPRAPILQNLPASTWQFQKDALKIPVLVPSTATDHALIDVTIPPALQAALNGVSFASGSDKSKPWASLTIQHKNLAQGTLTADIDISKWKATKPTLTIPAALTGKILVADISPPPPNAELEFVLQPSECKYSVEQITPLYEGFQNGELYLRLTGENPTKPGSSCMVSAEITNNLIAKGQGQGQVQFKERVEQAFSTQANIVRLHVLNVAPSGTAAMGDGAKAGVSFHSNHGQLTLSNGTDNVFYLQTSPPPSIRGPTQIAYGKRLLSGEEGDTEHEVLEGFQGLAVLRKNWLFFDAENLSNWRVHVASRDVELCKHPDQSDQFNPGGTLCIIPMKATQEPLQVELSYQPPCKNMGLPDGSPDGCRVNLGSTLMPVNSNSTDLQMALNLEERAMVFCPHTEGTLEPFFSSIAPSLKQTPVKVTSFSGTRALPARDLDQCVVLISLNQNDAALSSSGTSKQPPTAKEKAEQLLRHMGTQTIQIKARVPPRKDTDKESVLFSKIVRIGPESVNTQNFHDDAYEIPIHLKFDGINLGDYDIIEIQVSHKDPRSYTSNAESFPDSSMTGRLRMMPAWFAGRIHHGVGPRAFFTAQVPTGLVRIPNSGYQATSSSSYRLAESAIFGIGGMFVIEFYDFDRAVPPIPFNPQLHVGVLASTIPQSGLEPPRLSAIVGAGFRLLGGEKTVSGTDSGLSTVVWLEWADRARHPWEPALLIGFSVNIGSFPN